MVCPKRLYRTLPRMLARTAFLAAVALAADVTVSRTAESPFTETLTVDNGNELWVMGQLVPGPAVEVAFDGAQTSVGGVLVHEIPAPEASDELLQRMYANIPRVIDCMTAGMTLRQASAVYGSEVNALVDQACFAYNLGGDALLRQVLESSPLIARVAQLRDGRARIAYRGREIPSTVVISCNPADQSRVLLPPGPLSKASSAFGAIQLAKTPGEK